MSRPSLRRATVRLSGVRCGTLEELPGGGTHFLYDPDHLAREGAFPVSLTMPLRAEPYTSTRLLPFFLNLLPEGWLLDISLARLKVARDDAFGLLLATCRDCVGECEVVPAEGPTEDGVDVPPAEREP
ncbi:MAG: HipA N-terminal domain-containing protein [Planctomycetes bacterium]|nr:HipA N-terminal domain-containing protein [Planctomycetota bacterium]